MNLFYIQNIPCTCEQRPGFKATPEQPHHPDCPRTPYLGTECPVCKRTITSEVCDGGRFVSDGCSEFCAVVPDKELEPFVKGMKDGDWGVYPCSECGCPMEDEYHPGSFCSSCAPKVKIRELEARVAELENQRKVAVDAGFASLTGDARVSGVSLSCIDLCVDSLKVVAVKLGLGPDFGCKTQEEKESVATARDGKDGITP